MEVTPPDVSQAPHLPSLLVAHHQHLKCPHLCGDLSKQQQQLLDILSNSLFSDLILSKKKSTNNVDADPNIQKRPFLPDTVVYIEDLEKGKI